MGAKKQAYCNKGHRLEGHNAIQKEFGWRECRICANRRKKEYYYVRAFCKRKGIELPL